MEFPVFSSFSLQFQDALKSEHEKFERIPKLKGHLNFCKVVTAGNFEFFNLEIKCFVVDLGITFTRRGLFRHKQNILKTLVFLRFYYNKMSALTEKTCGFESCTELN